MKLADDRMKMPSRKALAAALVALCGLAFAPRASTAARTAALPQAGAVHPSPASAPRFRSAASSVPPDTAFCRRKLKISCYQPAQLQNAYNLNPLFTQELTGAGTTIVIVDSFGSPTIAEDLKHFDEAFGLPAPPSFKVIQPAGTVPPYPADPFGPEDRSGWAGETTLDVEWAHVFAPGASILLVATPTAETEGVQGFPEIVKAENYVIDHNLGDVISQSFAATEETFPSPASIRNLRSAFMNARQHDVSVLGASGDAGATDALADGSCCYASRVNSWPSSDPLVTSVGGTQLHLNAKGSRTAPDNVWNDIPVFGPDGGAGGGGPSHVFARPTFQDTVRDVVGGARGTPDVSLNAAVDGGVDVFSSFCDYGAADPHTGKPPLCGPRWTIFGGTSASTPEFAGIVAIADQAAGHRLGWLNPSLYQGGIGGIVDITRGNNTYVFCSANCGTKNETDTTVPGFRAATGYDMASGLGTVDAAGFVAALCRQNSSQPATCP